MCRGMFGVFIMVGEFRSSYATIFQEIPVCVVFFPAPSNFGDTN